jgi:hypothetical protein
MHPEDNRLLVDEHTAAEMLSISPIVLRKQRSQGHRPGCIAPVPYVRLGRKAIRYRIVDLVEYAQKYLVTDATAEAAL